MEKRIVFITGGCRSGKSRFALNYANRNFPKKIYLATCEALDEEMAQRIEHHKKTRGLEWQTIEEPIDVVHPIRQYGDEADVILLLDCLTLWLSNLLMRQKNDSEIVDEVKGLMDAIQQSQASVVLVSNEVGMGIVPGDPLSRRFRDLSGMVNQKVAEVADTVILMVSGMPLFLKGAE